MTGTRRRRRRNGVPPQRAKRAASLLEETEVPQHIAPPIGKVGDQVQMNIQAGEGQVHIHFGTLIENILLSPSDARQMSKVLLKAALASEAKAVEKAAALVGPELAIEILEKRIKDKEAQQVIEETENEVTT